MCCETVRCQIARPAGKCCRPVSGGRAILARSDEDPGVWAASSSLSKNLGGAVVGPALAAVLGDSKEEEERRRVAATYLGTLDGVPPASVAALAAVVKSDQSDAVIVLAARSLGQLRAESHADVFAAVLAADMPERLRTEAASALGKLGAASVQHQGALRVLAAESSDAAVAIAAALFIAECQLLGPAELAAIVSKKPRECKAASVKLLTLGPAAITPRVDALAGGLSNKLLRDAVITTFGAMGDDAAASADVVNAQRRAVKALENEWERSARPSMCAGADGTFACLGPSPSVTMCVFGASVREPAEPLIRGFICFYQNVNYTPILHKNTFLNMWFFFEYL